MIFNSKILNNLFNKELETFKNHFDESMVSEIQDLRGLSILWLSYYFKNYISQENRINIVRFVDEIHSRENFSFHGWYRIPALQATAFTLTSNEFYANALIRNINCGQSANRSYILKCVSIIAPLLSFENEYLSITTLNNIEFNHGLYFENFLLFLTTNGSNEIKKSWLDNNIEDSEKPHVKEFLLKFKNKTESFSSGFFINTFNDIKSYILFKFLNQSVKLKNQQQLFNEIVNLDEIYESERNHPLNKYYFNFRYLISDKG